MFRRALEWFGGSVLVYALVAACAGADLDGKGDAPSGGADGSGANGMGPNGSGATGNSPGSTGGSSIMNPVPDALAFPESGSRLKVQTISGSDGSANIRAGTFYDSQLEEVCYPGRAADGVSRCLPSGAFSALFSGPGCSTRIPYATKGSCLNAKYLQWTTSDASACGTTTRSHLAVIGDETTPTALYQGTPEACTAVAPAALDIYLEIYDFYEVGPELPASTFVEITDGTL